MMTQEIFAARMAALRLPGLPPHVAVAVSGGADSMALTLLAAGWAQEAGIRLTALTVDHGLRVEAAAEATQVQHWLAQRGIACEVLRVSEPIGGANLQEKARNARYHVLAGWCHAHGVAHLLLAHHAEDQLETVLLRLIRASGVEGLAGMRSVSERHGITLLRPLLGTSKAHLRAVLDAWGQPWLEDPSNRSAAFARNRMRPVAEALAAEGLDAARVALLTSQLAMTADHLHAEVAAWLCAHARYHGQEACVALDAWRHVPREIGWRALRQLIMEAGTARKPPRSENLLPLFEALAAGHMTKPRTLGGCLLVPRPKENTLSFVREP